MTREEIRAEIADVIGNYVYDSDASLAAADDVLALLEGLAL